MRFLRSKRLTYGAVRSMREPAIEINSEELQSLV